MPQINTLSTQTRPFNDNFLVPERPLFLQLFGAGKEEINLDDLRAQLQSLSDDSYINLLFPVNEKGNQQEIEELVGCLQRQEAREKFLRILSRALEHYSLRLSSENGSVKVCWNRISWDCNRLSHELNSASSDWKRLTRILQSLKDLGLEEYARALYMCLHDLANSYGSALVGGEQLQEWYHILGEEAQMRVSDPIISHHSLVKISRLEPNYYWA